MEMDYIRKVLLEPGASWGPGLACERDATGWRADRAEA
jgi:hypothetical protein